VLVCTGIFSRPHQPGISGLEGFTGRVLHSIDYRVPEVFAGQVVLVVGLGSSAVDVAIDLAGISGSVTISTRRAVMIVPRTIGGRPLDHHLSRLIMHLPARLRDRWRRQLVLGEYGRRGIDDPLAIWRRAQVPFDPATAGGVASDDLLPRLLSGEIGLRPAIKHIEGPEVIFADGSRLRPDTIILCTGYELDFPFLPAGLRPWMDEESGLYRLVFPPGHPTLAFIGACRAQGPILPIVEMQARWATQVLAGTVRLPAPAVMWAEINERWRRQADRRDSPIRVVLLPYLDELGEEIGVRPRLWRHPLLLRALLTGPPVAAQYRLDGPHRWSGAAAIVRASVTSRRPATFNS
jgi:dimethylaniline monooxygenase (N-oxide forming)